jgi:transcriptional regulator with XRE-family HTH domain
MSQAKSAASAATLSQALTQVIRELLQREGWSQREFAQRLGVTQGAVSYLLAEKRRAAVLDYYDRLARVFGVSLSVLIADLEHRVSHAQGVAHARSVAPTVVGSYPSAASFEGGREESVVLRAVLQALIDSRIEAAHASITARVEAAIVALESHGVDRRGDERHRRPHPRPPAPSPATTKARRRRAPPKKRADDPPASEPPLRADPQTGEALPVGRSASPGGLRRTG